MKKIFEEYGMMILAFVVVAILISVATFVKEPVSASVNDVADKFIDNANSRFKTNNEKVTNLVNTKWKLNKTIDTENFPVTEDYDSLVSTVLIYSGGEIIVFDCLNEKNCYYLSNGWWDNEITEPEYMSDDSPTIDFGTTELDNFDNEDVINWLYNNAVLVK